MADADADAAARHVLLAAATALRASPSATAASAAPATERASAPPAIPSHTSFLRSPPPLTAVVLACSARPELDALVPAISRFIDTNGQRWTIERACELGHVQLLQRVVAHERPSSTLRRYRAHVFSRALVHAVRHDSFAMLECLHAYCPGGDASRAMKEAAARGNVLVLDWFLAHCRTIVWSRAFAHAAVRGRHLHVLQWLYTHAPDDPSELFAGAVQLAAADGQLATTQWLLATAAVTTQRTLERDAFWRAAERGHVAILQHLHADRGFRDTMPPAATVALSSDTAVHLIDAAAASGSLETIQWLDHHGYRSFSAQAISRAARDGHLPIVYWLLERVAENGGDVDAMVDSSDWATAAIHGHLEVAQLLYDVRPLRVSTQDGDDLLVKTVENGHLRVAKWLYAMVYGVAPAIERDLSVLYRRLLWPAATNGHLAVVKWIYRSLRRFATEPQTHEEDAISGAAYREHRDIATWLYEHWAGDSRPRCFVYSVAGNRDLDLVQWLMTHSSAMINATAIDAAAKSGDVDMLAYLRAFTSVEAARWAMSYAAAGNHLAVVEWLARHGAPSVHAFKSAVANDRLRVAKWLYIHAPSTSRVETSALSDAVSVRMVQWLLTVLPDGDIAPTVHAAAERGDLDTLLLLHEVRSASATVEDAVKALANGHLEVFQWLLEMFPDAIAIEEVRRGVERLETAPAYMPPVLAQPALPQRVVLRFIS